MSVTDEKPKEYVEGILTMPVRELPMPPVKIQRQDTSGGVVMHSQRSGDRIPVPQLSNIKLKTTHA